jgi:hypothetical protein
MRKLICVILVAALMVVSLGCIGSNNEKSGEGAVLKDVTASVEQMPPLSGEAEDIEEILADIEGVGNVSVQTVANTTPAYWSRSYPPANYKASAEIVTGRGHISMDFFIAGNTTALQKKNVICGAINPAIEDFNSLVDAGYRNIDFVIPSTTAPSSQPTRGQYSGTAVYGRIRYDILPGKISMSFYGPMIVMSDGDYYNETNIGNIVANTPTLIDKIAAYNESMSNGIVSGSWDFYASGSSGRAGSRPMVKVFPLQEDNNYLPYRVSKYFADPWELESVQPKITATTMGKDRYRAAPENFARVEALINRDRLAFAAQRVP